MEELKEIVLTPEQEEEFTNGKGVVEEGEEENE